MTAAPNTSPAVAPVVAEPAKPSVLDEIAQRTMAALNPITGTYDEKLRAFKDYSANLAQSGIGLNGWTTMSEHMTACWMADAMQVHPAVFEQGNYLMTGKSGNKVVEPKWEFLNGLLRARLPDFSFKIEREDDNGCTIIFRVGDEEHTVTYTVDDAKRQGFIGGKGNMWTSGNTREGCFKQAFKRGARRVGAHVLMGLPDRDDENQPVEPPQAAANPAAALAAALPVEDEKPKKPANEIKRLAVILERLWSLKPKDVAGKLVKAGMVMSQIRGVPVKYETPEHLSPSDAKEIADFLDAKYPNGAVPDGGSEGTNGGTEAPPASPAAEPVKNFDEQHADAAMAEEDEAPPPVGEAAPPVDDEREAEAKAAQHLFEQDGKISTLVMLDQAAKKALSQRVFLKEAPANSKKHWFVDEDILKSVGSLDDAGNAKSIKVVENGRQMIDADLCRRLCVEMRKAGIGATGDPLPRHAGRRR